MNTNSRLDRALLGLLLIGMTITAFLPGCSTSSLRKPVTENNFDSTLFNSFVEPDFPFFSTYLDSRNLGNRFPDINVVARGLIVQLGDSAYACFDRDLLRWSVAWSGKILTESMLPQVSYKNFFNKKNTVPLLAGTPSIATGMYPGWSAGKPVTDDVRPESQRREGFSWGPLPEYFGRWNGFYVYGSAVVLDYEVSQIRIREVPGALVQGKEVVFSRTLDVSPTRDSLFLNAAEIAGGSSAVCIGQAAYIYYGENKDSVTAVQVYGRNGDAQPAVQIKNRRVIQISVPPSKQTNNIKVVMWRGLSRNLETVRKSFVTPIADVPRLDKGSPPRWVKSVLTRGQLSPDTAAFVTDLLTLPVPNPWRRNVRVTDIAFFDADKAAVATFEGDVWLVKGIRNNLKNLSWTRFASGLYEPQSIEIFKGQLYAFGKEGIVRLHDLNRDGEADFYENFSDLMHQSAESYEWAADMIFTEDKYITIAKGGGLTARPGITKELAPGFRAGSNHSGTIMRISPDGRRAEVHSSGFRAPYLGMHPTKEILTATDQQGNYVQSTPIFVVEKGDFFGVPATSHRNDNPQAKRPLTWIPHRVDRSAGGQVWITSGKMGPLNDRLVHFSFGRPGLFQVLIDSTVNAMQGAVAPIHANYPVPVLKGSINPGDGQLYMAGFNLFGSSSKGISAVQRLRYTGKPSYMPTRLRAGSQGLVISFDCELNRKAAEHVAGFRVKRWNYERTHEYGSGHFKSDGTPGEEILPVLASYLSVDKKSVLLLIPGMIETDQMELTYQLQTRDGKRLDDGIWFSINHVQDLNLNYPAFRNVDLNKLKLSKDQLSSLLKSDPPITRDRGRVLFNTMGCVGCHSPGTETAGMYGPPLKGLYGSERMLADGSTVTADDNYLKESILDPGKKIAKDYEAEMPSFRGVLSDADIESVLLYIMYLKY
jgi:mono/diheme cytochrome c family protein